jgi:hypothetical protein
MHKKVLFLFLAAFLVIACSNKPADLKHSSGKYLDSSRDLIESFENAMRQAKSEEIDVRSPKEFEKASEAFDDAREIYREGGEIEDFHDKMNEAREHLDRASEQAKK